MTCWMQPPLGLEEGTWVAVRRVCIALGGLKSKDLDADHGNEGQGSAPGESGEDSSTPTGGDVTSLAQGALVRILACRKPQVQVT